ncbi:reverse transcriptase family protein [Lignipirellula cremea]|uniref:RNA-directed DNA polymerase n=1 Tax=Lignipirellula cremea TaxID=2528010 RepID=A0A518DV26_9BACT|nr:reverse transcriptase family protein [Lignipirellula cremea]QDU95677.1 Reverse transcriptase (RNA-dependent DNA polymerase) [Lignipirellula cremea]
MTDPPRTRQELYDLIRETSREEFILEEMIRLGFWSESTAPENPANEIRRQAELQRELQSLLTENRRLVDLDKAKKALRRERMAESRRRQKETKERREAERQARAAAWQAEQERSLAYLGEGVSAGLMRYEVDDRRLARNGLAGNPLATPLALAQAMQISLGELRFLAFSRRTSQTTHYQRFQIPKKTGGLRSISAPMPRLKRAQEWILRNVLENVPMHPAAHGFRTGRSIITNAQPHVGAAIVANVDLQDFFPSVGYPRIKGLFRTLGLSEATSTVLALLCSEPEIDEVVLDGQTYYTARSERRLPQGAPTSPAITNLLCRGLDARLQSNAEKLGFVYTRYADDITFSSQNAQADVGRALRRIRHVVASEGFTVHPDKTRILRRGSRQEVTGLTVNDRLGVSRELLRRFRAVVHSVEKTGPAGKRWGESPHLMSSLAGFANFIAMVDPEKGKPWQARVAALIEQHGRGPDLRSQRKRWVSPVPAAAAAPSTETASKPSESSNRPWWKIW